MRKQERLATCGACGCERPVTDYMRRTKDQQFTAMPNSATDSFYCGCQNEIDEDPPDQRNVDDAELTLARIRPADVGVTMSGAPAWHDIEAWRHYVEGWEVSLPIPFHFEVLANGAQCSLRVSSRMPDSRHPFEADTVIDLEVEVSLPTSHPTSTTHLWLRALLRWFLLHELDEYILVDGERLFDPHANGSTPTPENS